MQGSLQASHVHAGCYTVSDCICNRQTVQPIPVLDEIEVITAQDLSGTAKSRQCQSLDSRRSLGEQSSLEGQ